MKVLLIWEEIPERTTLYALEGVTAQLALSAAGQYVNAGKGNNNAEALSAAIEDIEPLGNGKCSESFDITGFDRVVISGFVM